MGRVAARDGRLYMNLTSGGTAEPLAYLSKYNVSFTQTRIKVTAFGDTTEQYVAGLSDFQGGYSGFFDTATVQTYTAATDGIARKFYLYPVAATASSYWFGTALFDMSIDADVDGPVAISGSIAAGGPVFRVG